LRYLEERELADWREGERDEEDQEVAEEELIKGYKALKEALGSRRLQGTGMQGRLAGMNRRSTWKCASRRRMLR
jgi:hypothetical protein